MDFDEQLNLKDQFWQSAFSPTRFVPLGCNCQADVGDVQEPYLPCRALTFRRVKAPSLQPKGAADGASKKKVAV